MLGVVQEIFYLCEYLPVFIFSFILKLAFPTWIRREQTISFYNKLIGIKYKNKTENLFFLQKTSVLPHLLQIYTLFCLKAIQKNPHTIKNHNICSWRLAYSPILWVIKTYCMYLFKWSRSNFYFLTRPSSQIINLL